MPFNLSPDTDNSHNEKGEIAMLKKLGKWMVETGAKLHALGWRAYKKYDSLPDEDKEKIEEFAQEIIDKLRGKDK